MPHQSPLSAARALQSAARALAAARSLVCASGVLAASATAGLLAASATAGLLAASATAGLAQGQADSMSDVTLIPGWYTDSGSYIAGIRIELSPGWHTYWRSPGGAGIPPQFDWSGSSGSGAVTVHWPNPQVYEAFDLRSAVYHDQVVFPVEIPSAAPGDRLRLSMIYGVCDEICIPAEARVTLTVPPPGGTGPEAGALRAALASGPRDARGAGVTGFTCALRPAETGFELTAEVRFDRPAPAPEMTVFESGTDDTWITTRRVTHSASSLHIAARVDHGGDGGFALDRSQLRLTLLGKDLPENGRAIELRGCTGG